MADYEAESQAFLAEQQVLAASALQQAEYNNLPAAAPLPNISDDGFEFRPRPLSHARTEPSAMLRELAAAEGHTLQDFDSSRPLGRPPRHPALPSPEDTSSAAKSQEGSSQANQIGFERQDTPGLKMLCSKPCYCSVHF